MSVRWLHAVSRHKTERRAHRSLALCRAAPEQNKHFYCVARGLIFIVSPQQRRRERSNWIFHKHEREGIESVQGAFYPPDAHTSITFITHGGGPHTQERRLLMIITICADRAAAVRSGDVSRSARHTCQLHCTDCSSSRRWDYFECIRHSTFVCNDHTRWEICVFAPAKKIKSDSPTL